MKTFTIIFLLFILSMTTNGQVKILFDATKAESAGNADWVIDADAHNISYSAGPAVVVPGANDLESNAQRYPTPDQSTVTSSTSETYWQGAISAWGIDCVKKGYQVETLPYNGQITYGNAGNLQDLSNYKVFIVCEPNIVFSTSEKTALINFVQNGGGLFMVSDHTISDRNNDGWDSPAIWNDFMSNNGTQSNPFGMTFDLADFSQTTSNIPSLPGDPLLHGVMGDVTQAMWSNGTSMTLTPGSNSSIKGVVYKTGSSFGNSNVMCAYATYGNGRVVGFGDSSPCDDGTGDPGDQLYSGWTGEANGSHEKLLMNATIWLASSTSGAAPTATTQAGSSVTATTATLNGIVNPNSASTTYHFDWGLTNSYTNSTTTTSAGSGSSATNVNAGISGLTPGTLYHFRVSATNSVGTTNGNDLTFTTSTPTLSVTPTNQPVSASAGSTSFTVTSNTAWTAVSNQTSWCTVTPSGSGNGTITATFTLNSMVTQRVANVTVTVSGLTPIVVTVTQAAASPTLSVTPSNQAVPAGSGNTSFSVTSNSSWSAVSNQSWCTVTPSGNGDGTIAVSYLQNQVMTPRTANITVSVSGLLPVTVTVSQETSITTTEPTNFPTDFSGHNIVVQWNDATGGVVPTGYLIRMSNIGFSSIVTPLDGTMVPDSFSDKNVVAGVQEAWFKNLQTNTTYYFKIFAYQGWGSSIDYKTDGEIPTVQQTTGE